MHAIHSYNVKHYFNTAQAPTTAPSILHKYHLAKFQKCNSAKCDKVPADVKNEIDIDYNIICIDQQQQSLPVPLSDIDYNIICIVMEPSLQSGTQLPNIYII